MALEIQHSEELSKIWNSVFKELSPMYKMNAYIYIYSLFIEHIQWVGNTEDENLLQTNKQTNKQTKKERRFIDSNISIRLYTCSVHFQFFCLMSPISIGFTGSGTDPVLKGRSALGGPHHFDLKRTGLPSSSKTAHYETVYRNPWVPTSSQAVRSVVKATLAFTIRMG